MTKQLPTLHEFHASTATLERLEVGGRVDAELDVIVYSVGHPSGRPDPRCDSRLPWHPG
jgi:hypothetical protein